MEITRLRVAFAALALVITALWLISVPADVFGGDFWSTRRALILAVHRLHGGGRAARRAAALAK